MDSKAVIVVSVASIHRLATDIVELELVAADHVSLPAFLPGSHIDVMLPNGQTRQYSLCNTPRELHCYKIAVLRESRSRGGSAFIHEAVDVGSALRISPPKNLFPLQETKDGSLLLAGGIGITPIRSMAEHLHSVGADFLLHYCCRTRQRAAYFEDLASSSFASRCSFHFGDEPETGMDIQAALSRTHAESHIYACGPEGFISMVRDSALAAGFDKDRIHQEYFVPVSSHAGTTERGFQVKLAKSGKIYSVPPDRSVAQVLLTEGVDVQTSCEQGVCGTCLVRILEGSPDHRDVVLTDEERLPRWIFCAVLLTFLRRYAGAGSLRPGEAASEMSHPLARWLHQKYRFSIPS